LITGNISLSLSLIKPLPLQDEVPSLLRWCYLIRPCVENKERKERKKFLLLVIVSYDYISLNRRNLWTNMERNKDNIAIRINKEESWYVGSFHLQHSASS
jgi:hypothetical protein